MRILVVEDEEIIRKSLVARFLGENFVVEAAADGEEGFFLASEYEFDAAIVDLGLPKLSGMDLIKKLRTQEKNFPILALTARGKWQDKVEGLQSGADDYVVKPFHMEEVVARVNAIVRRASGHATPEIAIGDIVLNTLSHQVTCNHQELDLTTFEYKVLEYLMLHAGEVVTKATLTEHLYAQDFDRDSNVIEVFVARLRKKIEACDVENPIETLRGRGYRFKQ